MASVWYGGFGTDYCFSGHIYEGWFFTCYLSFIIDNLSYLLPISIYLQSEIRWFVVVYEIGFLVAKFLYDLNDTYFTTWAYMLVGLTVSNL